MTNPMNPRSDLFTPPALADLLAQYLHRQADAQAAGLSGIAAGAEVEPYEAVPVQPVDARVAWDEARTALTLFQPAADLSALAVPPDWPALVAGQEPIMGLALSTGNFPQAVRYLHAFLQAADLKDLRPGGARPVSAPILATWADEVSRGWQFPQTLVALGVLRLAKQFTLADELLSSATGKIPAAWRDAWANERAALAWHRGEADEAIRMWQAQPESVPVLFNRGMAALFSDQPAEARSWLRQAVATIAADSSWHHLGKLYLALAEMRS